MEDEGCIRESLSAEKWQYLPPSNIFPHRYQSRLHRAGHGCCSDIRWLTSPDESHKNAQSAVRGLCNAQTALQRHSGRSVSWLCRCWALALLCRQQPGPNNKETSHTFWIAMIAQTPFNTCSMAQERTETSPPASQRKAGLIASECFERAWQASLAVQMHQAIA